jgi:hypothetical protein
MNCPHCDSTRTTRLQRTTNLGYAMFRCKDCWRTFNERTGTPFNFIEMPTDIVFQVLLCRLRYKLSFRDIVEFFCCEDLSLLMKLCAIGKNALLLYLSSNCEPNARERSARFGLSTKRTFESAVDGVTCTEPSMRTAS